MQKTEFVVEIDGQRVIVDQTTQEVRVLDDAGKVRFRNRIQVAARSGLGIFSAVQGLTDPGAGIRSSTKA